MNLTTVDSNVDVDTGTDWGMVLIQDQTSERTTRMTREGVVMGEGHVCLCFSNGAVGLWTGPRSSLKTMMVCECMCVC